MTTTTKIRKRPTSTLPVAAAIYCRISADRNGEGLGVERQEELCRKLARQLGWIIIAVFIDNDISAYSGKRRPQYEAMLQGIEAGRIDGVLCVDLDRLTRQPKELERFIDLANVHGIALANVSGNTDLATSNGRMTARIIGAVARQESELKGERVSREAQQAAKRGVPRGAHRPFGYRADHMTIDAREAKLVREMVERVLAGESCTSIAVDFNARSIATPQKAAHGWSGAAIASVLRNARIYGARTYHGEVVKERAWKGIIDRKTYERVQSSLKRVSSPGRRPQRLLTSIATCGLCGSPLRPSVQLRNGRSDARYICHKKPGSPGCGRIGINAEWLDELLTEDVLSALASKSFVKELRRKPAKRTRDLDLAAIDRQLEENADDYGNKRITRAVFLTVNEGLMKQRAEALAEIEADADTGSVAPYLSGDVHKTWNEQTVAQQRAVLSTLISSIAVNPSSMPKGSKTMDPDRVEVLWKI
jgi:DNA invertase Pin-like site-specific DNA recombinase